MEDLSSFEKLHKKKENFLVFYFYLSMYYSIFNSIFNNPGEYFIFLHCGRIEIQSEVIIFRTFGKENITVENGG